MTKTGCVAALVCLLAGTAIADTPCLATESLFAPQIVGRCGDAPRLLDLAPEVPVELGHTPLPDIGAGAALSGNLVCVAAQDTGLLTYDIGDPAHRYPLGQIALGRYARRVALVGDVTLRAGARRCAATRRPPGRCPSRSAAPASS